MANFTVNDVLLKHNSDVLSFAVDSVGNRKFQVYLDIYRSAFLCAEERKDSITCNKIANDIVNTICTKSVPSGRFLEFDEKNNVWYNVGTGAIPCQRARTGLLGLLGKTSNEYHVDKPIVDMSKTKRARTMKALHFSEKKLRAVVNLNDERFKLKEEVLINDTLSCTPLVEKRSTYKKSNDKHVKFADSVTSSNRPNKNEGRSTKRRKVMPPEATHVDVVCGGVGEGILNIDTPGNRLFHSLIDSRLENYTKSDDKDKFKEVCKVIEFMKKICPTCRFVTYKENSNEPVEISWQDTMEKTIHSLCNPCMKDGILSDKEIETFIAMHDDYIADLTYNDVPDVVKSVDDIDNTLGMHAAKNDAPDDIFSTIITEDNKALCSRGILVEDYLMDETTNLICNPEQHDYLDVLFPEIDETINEYAAAEEFLESILVP